MVRHKIALLFDTKLDPNVAELWSVLAENMSDEFEFHIIFLGSQALLNEFCSGIVVHHVPLKKWGWLKSMQQIKELLIKNKIKVLQTYQIQHNFWGYCLEKLSQDLNWITILNDLHSLERGAIKKFFFKRIIRKKPWTVFWSERDRSLMSSHIGLQRASVIRPGAVKVLDRVLDQAVSPHLVFIGPLDQEHGCLDLLKAFELIKSTHPALTLDLYGDGPLKFKLILKYQVTKYAKDIRFHPFPQSYKVVFQSNVIYVQPFYKEGLTQAFIEAMNSCVSIVAYRNAALDAALPNKSVALFGVAGDIIALSLHLKKILKDKSLSHNLRQESKTCFEQNFNMAAMIEKYRVLYRVATN